MDWLELTNDQIWLKMKLIHQSYGVLQCLRSLDLLSNLDSNKMALRTGPKLGIYIYVY